MGPIIPGLSHGYRTTAGMFKWIVLIGVIGAVVLFFVFRRAIQEADDIYDKSGFIPRRTNPPVANP